MTAATTNSYDEVPYTSFPFPDTHPDRLATIGRLFGLSPKDISQCRVLELGCSTGGNIMPMAELLPDSTFLGVDLSQRQVAAGQQMLAELKLKNIELRHASITNVDESYGKFDYIICHGVYSWVPDAVQSKIMSICKENLNPAGIAYISYNTLPGWHMRGMVRDMMRYHANRFGDAPTRIGQARALLDFLVKASGDVNNAYTSLLKGEVELLKQCQDWYLFHEHLEEINSPIYFYQFVERANAHGLKFLGEAHVKSMVPGNYPPEVEEVLQRLSNDIIHIEQYMDFLRNRTFRQSLLCQADQKPQYGIDPIRLRGLHIASALRPNSPKPDLATTAAEKFQTPFQPNTVTVTDPLPKHAIMILAEAWPRTLPFEHVVREARQRLTPALKGDAAAVTRDEQTLGRMFLQFLTSPVDRLVEVRSRPLPIAREPGDRPKTTKLARLQAQRGVPAVGLKHEMATLGQFEAEILQRLDGLRDRTRLVDALMGVVNEGKLTVSIDNKPMTDPAQLRAAVGQGLDLALKRFADLAYLVE